MQRAICSLVRSSWSPKTFTSVMPGSLHVYVWSGRVDLNHRSELDQPAGLEPAASGSARRRSAPLSYGWIGAAGGIRTRAPRFERPGSWAARRRQRVSESGRFSAPDRVERPRTRTVCKQHDQSSGDRKVLLEMEELIAIAEPGVE